MLILTPQKIVFKLKDDYDDACIFVKNSLSAVYLILKTTKYSKPWTRDSQCQDWYCLAKISKMPLHFSAQVQKPKIFGNRPALMSIRG